MRTKSNLVKENATFARTLWGKLPPPVMKILKQLTNKHQLCISLGDLILLDARWYVTHSGLLGLAYRHRCAGIKVEPVKEFCSLDNARWAFRVIVFRSETCKGFVGHGHADSSNISPLVCGAEMRAAKTRAVKRAA
jgi:hypothetical protein